MDVCFKISCFLFLGFGLFVDVLESPELFTLSFCVDFDMISEEETIESLLLKSANFILVLSEITLGLDILELNWTIKSLNGRLARLARDLDDILLTKEAVFTTVTELFLSRLDFVDFVCEPVRDNFGCECDLDLRYFLLLFLLLFNESMDFEINFAAQLKIRLKFFHSSVLQTYT